MKMYKEDLERCKDYHDILDVIGDLLKSKKFDITINHNEIRVSNATKKDIEKIIYNVDVPKKIIKLLITIKSHRDDVFIVKKMR